MDALSLLRVYPELNSGDPLSDDVLLYYLDIAKDVILKQRYPFEVVTELPDEYVTLQVEMAVEMIAKIGAEGQVSHSENEVSRHYAASTISPGLLRRIIPKAGFPR